MELPTTSPQDNWLKLVYRLLISFAKQIAIIILLCIGTIGILAITLEMMSINNIFK